MKTIRTIVKTDTTNKLTVAFDVSKDKLNYYSGSIWKDFG